MLNIFSVFIGGGLGSVLRYLVNITFGKSPVCQACMMPLATLSVNIIGCFILGLLYSIVVQKAGFPPHIKLALTVGFCGGLTTFSAFSMEIYELLNEGQIYASLGYILLSVIICIIMTAAGIYAGTLLGVYFGKQL